MWGLCICDVAKTFACHPRDSFAIALHVKLNFKFDISLGSSIENEKFSFSEREKPQKMTKISRLDSQLSV
jgi:hypothetical protein